MNENLEFEFLSDGRRRPKAPPNEQIEAVCAFLTGKGWMKACQIEKEIGLNERKVRLIAEHSGGRILGSHKGYRISDRSATIEDVDLSAGKLESQSRRLLGRAREIRKYYHRYGRVLVKA